jgi:hypothetical protein
MFFIQRCFIGHPSDSAVSEDAGIEPSSVPDRMFLGLPDPLVRGSFYYQANKVRKTLIFYCFEHDPDPNQNVTDPEHWNPGLLRVATLALAVRRSNHAARYHPRQRYVLFLWHHTTKYIYIHLKVH